MDMQEKRQYWRKRSNNKNNPNKNVCTFAVCRALGVDNEVRYLHNYKDVVRAMRKRYIVRSRLSTIGKNTSVAQARAKVRRIQAEEKGIAYLVRVPGHVLLLNGQGQTTVDTDQRIRDKRRITAFYIIKQK